MPHPLTAGHPAPLAFRPMRRIGKNPYVYVSGAFGALWVLIAWGSPDRTFYLFPFLVAASVPVSYRLIAGRALPIGVAIGAGIAGQFNVFLLAGLLAIAGKLEGPTLLPAGGAVVDAIVLGIAGAAAGTLVAAWDFRRTR
jgi:hypothetical protein